MRDNHSMLTAFFRNASYSSCTSLSYLALSTALLCTNGCALKTYMFNGRLPADGSIDGNMDVQGLDITDTTTDLGTEVRTDIVSDTDVIIPDVPVDIPDTGCGSASMMLCGGTCIDTFSDPFNCGGCGNNCNTLPNVTGVGANCRNGVCNLSGVCQSGFGDCNGIPGDGCEASFSTNSNHCGGCNQPCVAPTGGSAVCTISGCEQTCPPNSLLIGTQCLFQDDQCSTGNSAGFSGEELVIVGSTEGRSHNNTSACSPGNQPDSFTYVISIPAQTMQFSAVGVRTSATLRNDCGGNELSCFLSSRRLTNSPTNTLALPNTSQVIVQADGEAPGHPYAVYLRASSNIEYCGNGFIEGSETCDFSNNSNTTCFTCRTTSSAFVSQCGTAQSTDINTLNTRGEIRPFGVLSTSDNFVCDDNTGSGTPDMSMIIHTSESTAVELITDAPDSVSQIFAPQGRYDQCSPIVWNCNSLRIDRTHAIIPGGDSTIFIDGPAAASGAFKLRFSPLLPSSYCSDTFVDGSINEECDDGNLRNGDGCDVNCRVETSLCPTAEIEPNTATSPQPLNPINCPPRVDGQFNIVGDEDYFTFPASAGQILEIGVYSPNASCLYGGPLSLLEVYSGVPVTPPTTTDCQGSQAIACFDSAAQSCGNVIIPVPANGQYTVRLRGNSADSYRARFNLRNPR